jgi:hypothetical protein
MQCASIHIDNINTLTISFGQARKIGPPEKMLQLNEFESQVGCHPLN